MSNRSGSSVIEGIEAIRKKYPDLTVKRRENSLSVKSVLVAIDEFMECVRYLNTRRSSGAVLNLDDEAAVQDTLYLMLRPWISDLVPGNPTDKIANRYSIKDFVSRELRLVIEAKFVRNPDHGKSISKELNDDIETYRYHPFCDDLVFFIYDPDANIPDVAALVRHIAQPRTYGNKLLRCYVVVKP